MFIIFVEGYDDEQFFEKFFSNSKYRIYQYSKKNIKKVNEFIKSLSCISNWNYLFFADSDGMTTEQKVNKLCETYTNLEKEKILIVRYEIESWYLAGVDESYCIKNKIKFFLQTDNITKEQFNDILPLKRKTRLQMMLDILLNFDVEIAKIRNDSLYDFIIKKEELDKAV
jgi:hypothetical protein